jgi:Mg-chelatase subunit ChlD
MRPALPAVNEGVREFIRQAGEGDRISVIIVKDSADVGVAPTPDADQALRELGTVVAEGQTALFDGVYLALSRLLKSKLPSAAVLVLTDGGDNASRYHERELYSLAVEANAAVHSIVTAPGFPLSPESQGQAALKRLAAQTGGWCWQAHGKTDILKAVKRLVGNPRYVLAYTPPRAGGARSHQVEVRAVGKGRGLRLAWRRAWRDSR